MYPGQSVGDVESLAASCRSLGLRYVKAEVAHSIPGRVGRVLGGADLFEINETFAAQILPLVKEIGIPSI
jgi:hypothetical protein